MSRRFVLLMTVAAALTAGAFGISQASADTSATPDRGITVNGTAQVDVAGDATAAQVKAAYNGLFGPAIDDAKAKADLVAAKLGVTVGTVTAVVERSDQAYWGCAYPVGIADSGAAVGAPKPAVAKTPKPKAKHKKKKNKTRAASSPVSSPPSTGTTPPVPDPGPSSCPVQMQVSVTYAIG